LFRVKNDFVLFLWCSLKLKMYSENYKLVFSFKIIMLGLYIKILKKRRIIRPKRGFIILDKRGGSCWEKIYKFVQFVLKNCEKIMNIKMRVRTTLNKFVILFYFIYDIISCFLLCDFWVIIIWVYFFFPTTISFLWHVLFKVAKDKTNVEDIPKNLSMYNMQMAYIFAYFFVLFLWLVRKDISYDLLGWRWELYPYNKHWGIICKERCDIQTHLDKVWC